MFVSCYIKRLSPLWSLNQQQTENQAKETKNELDVAERQSALEDELFQLWIKLQRNQEQAILAEAQAESARGQAGGLEEVSSPTTVTESKSRSLKANPLTPDFCAISQYFLWFWAILSGV